MNRSDFFPLFLSVSASLAASHLPHSSSASSALRKELLKQSEASEKRGSSSHSQNKLRRGKKERERERRKDARPSSLPLS